MENRQWASLEVGAKASCAFVSLLYGTGAQFLDALVLGHSLKEAKVEQDTVLLHLGKLTPHQRKALKCVWGYLLEIEDNEVFERASKNVRNTFEGSRYQHVLCKFHALRLCEYEKVLLLDTDTFVHMDVSEIFDLPAPACQVSRRDVAWLSGQELPVEFIVPNAPGYDGLFNTGVVLLAPSVDDFTSLIDLISISNKNNRFFAQPDRDYFTLFFRERWHTLSAEYNYRPPFVEYAGSVAFGENPMDHEVCISHFYGAIKPSDMVFHSERVLQSEISELRRELCERILEFPLLCSVESAKTSNDRFIGMHKSWLVGLHEMSKIVEDECKRPVLSMCSPAPTVLGGEYDLAQANLAKRKARNAQLARKRQFVPEVIDKEEPFKFRSSKLSTLHGANTIRLKAG
jgi:hypothetical protein